MEVRGRRRWRAPCRTGHNRRAHPDGWLFVFPLVPLALHLRPLGSVVVRRQRRWLDGPHAIDQGFGLIGQQLVANRVDPVLSFFESVVRAEDAADLRDDLSCRRAHEQGGQLAVVLAQAACHIERLPATPFLCCGQKDLFLEPDVPEQSGSKRRIGLIVDSLRPRGGSCQQRIEAIVVGGKVTADCYTPWFVGVRPPAAGRARLRPAPGLRATNRALRALLRASLHSLLTEPALSTWPA